MLSTFLPSSVSLLPVAVLFVVALVLIFVGKKVAKALVFIAGGLAAAFLALALLTPYLTGLSIVAAIACFVLGGLLAIFALRLGIGLALGILGFSLASGLAGFAIAVVVGIVLLIIGVVLAEKILALATVLLGSLLLIQALTTLGLPLITAFAITAALAALGTYIQTRKH